MCRLKNQQSDQTMFLSFDSKQVPSQEEKVMKNIFSANDSFQMISAQNDVTPEEEQKVEVYKDDSSEEFQDAFDSL